MASISAARSPEPPALIDSIASLSSLGPLAKSPSSRGPRKRGGQITRLSEPLWNLEHRRQWTIQQSPSSEDHGFTGRRALKFVEAVWLLSTARVFPIVLPA